MRNPQIKACQKWYSQKYCYGCNVNTIMSITNLWEREKSFVSRRLEAIQNSCGDTMLGFHSCDEFTNFEKSRLVEEGAYATFTWCASSRACIRTDNEVWVSSKNYMMTMFSYLKFQAFLWGYSKKGKTITLVYLNTPIILAHYSLR